MAPVLPLSLSPHICILPSPDLTELLTASSLPSLPAILQSFSPLPQVTSRTTTLNSVSHSSFALRFSDLAEIEAGCREGEEQRAIRTIDWIGARVSRRCAKWVEDMERAEAKAEGKEIQRTPWWDEVKRCTEGDHIPSKTEGWNHPVAVVLAVSTTAPNPLQAITALHARPLEFPPWVDQTHLRYTLIIHPQNSPLSDEEAGALFNAVKKQFGLHSYLLRLSLPKPAPTPVPVPALIPRLPPPPILGSPNLSQGVTSSPDPAAIFGNAETAPLNTLRMSEQDIQQTARFTREFVVMNLLPWMEKCVLEWNENYSSTRRLPSRIFTSTRRLFGSSASSPLSTSTPSLPTSPTFSSGPARLNNFGDVQTSGALNPPSQQRRLAEFATVLGDFKLAVSVWESLRKDGKGGSDILPILLSPSPTIPLHASHALTTIHPPAQELPPHAQLRALVYAVRWEIGIATPDFLDDVLEGERWLVWAASNAEEPPSALLLAHAALLSARKSARRRAALWYLFAANRLEKCGIKPLTMYFLRKAHDLYKFKPEKTLSPSFWDSENQSPADTEGFDDIMPGIEHSLGRLLYTTGDIAGAVRFFLGLLRVSSLSLSSPSTHPITNGHTNGVVISEGSDKVFLEDFRVSFSHFKSTAGDIEVLSDLKAPFSFCVPNQTRLRLPRDSSDSHSAEWVKREDDWRRFWKRHGPEGLQRGGKAAVNEAFWVDLVLRNPLDAEVNLSSLTVTVEEILLGRSVPSESTVEVIDDMVLGPKETRTIPVAVKSSRPVSITITQTKYDFLTLLPSSEPLASRGRRLQETSLQRQNVMYAPDVLIKVEVEEASQKLVVNFVDDGQLVLAQGECKQMALWFSNAGTRGIDEVWMITAPEEEIWIGVIDSETPSSSATEVLHSNNSLEPRRPLRVPLTNPTLEPGQNVEVPFTLHSERVGEQDLALLFVFREKGGEFHSARVTRSYEVQPVLQVSAIAKPSQSPGHLFLLQLELENVASFDAVHITQVTTLSPTWSCAPLAEHVLGTISPSQSAHVFLGVNRWEHGSGCQETISFVSRKLSDVLRGREVEVSSPPPLQLLSCHTPKSGRPRSVQDAATRQFIHSGRRNTVAHSIANLHPHVPAFSHPSIFPLYNPASVDIVVFWDMPSQQRSGHLLISGITLGAGHAALKGIIEEAEGLKVKRSIYAETRKEKAEILDAIRASEWNVEMNPIVVNVQAGARIGHDFSRGCCQLSIELTLRNYSLTHTARYVLKLTSDLEAYPPSEALPPQYSGQLTFRGNLQPLQLITVRPKMCITRPGTYSVNGWRLETEVGEMSDNHDDRPWRTRHSYLQGPSPGDVSSVTVYDASQ